MSPALSFDGATLTPELYSCAVSVNGVADLGEMLGAAARSGLGENYWRVRIGNRFRDAKEISAVTPRDQAAKARAPIMLIHGKDDTVVPVGQSRAMASALKGADKPHEYIELAGEDHWLSGAETRTRMLEESMRFISAAIGK